MHHQPYIPYATRRLPLWCCGAVGSSIYRRAIFLLLFRKPSFHSHRRRIARAHAREGCGESVSAFRSSPGPECLRCSHFGPI